MKFNDENDPLAMIDTIIKRLDDDLKAAATCALINKDKEELLRIISSICDEQARRYRSGNKA